MQKAKGEFIAIADQDDIWYERKIERQIKMIGDKDLCCSAYDVGEYYDDKNKQTLIPLFNSERLIFANTIPGHTMLVRRSFFVGLNNWSDHFYYDWWLAVFASLNNSIVRVDISLNWHRTHEKSAIKMIRKTYIKKEISKPTYQPYLYGLRNLKQLKRKKAWTLFYSTIVAYDVPDNLAKKCAFLLLSNKWSSLLKLCVICSQNYGLIYPKSSNKRTNLIVSYLRGFFYPFIFSYNNCSFSL